MTTRGRLRCTREVWGAMGAHLGGALGGDLGDDAGGLWGLVGGVAVGGVAWR